MIKLQARKCSVEKIASATGRAFLLDNHRDGALKSTAGSWLGLYHENDLVGVAHFGSPRTPKKQKQYSKELLRLAFARDVVVVGGASKLIKAFTRDNVVYDFFTYQDTTGKATDVYGQAGMILVEESGRKSYLVAPGASLENASRKEKYGVPYVTRYGPDRILGTSLGEVFHPDGRRKTNIELFQDLGWRLVETSGDRVYEWRNANFSFYVYKITSSKDDGFYIGRRALRKPNATLEDCLQDGYMGSGGKKFKTWIASVGKASLQKEIIQIYSKWADAVEAEEKLIGKSHNEDHRCKNTLPGGTGKYPSSWKYLFHMGECEVHGVTKHFNGECCTCRNQKIVKTKECEVHGVTKHQGDTCCKCQSAINIIISDCVIHGPTKFIGKSCFRCSLKDNWRTKDCPLHGASLFNGGKCSRCYSTESFYEDDCALHGRTKFRGGACYKCRAEASIVSKVCAAHGETAFRGDACCKCSVISKDNTSVCEIHGETSFQYSKCKKCISEERDQLQECAIHGVTKFRGKSCYSCTVAKGAREDSCSRHGLTKFRGKNCCKCSTDKANHTRYHGKMDVFDSTCRFCVTKENDG